MTHVSRAGGRPASAVIVTAVLVIIAVLAIIAGILYLSEPARSLPSILGTITHPAARANAHRSLRGWASLAIGVICLLAAWGFSRTGRFSRR